MATNELLSGNASISKSLGASYARPVDSRALMESLYSCKMRLKALGMFVNPEHPQASERQKNISELEERIDHASGLIRKRNTVSTESVDGLWDITCLADTIAMGHYDTVLPTQMSVPISEFKERLVFNSMKNFIDGKPKIVSESNRQALFVHSLFHVLSKYGSYLWFRELRKKYYTAQDQLYADGGELETQGVKYAGDIEGFEIYTNKRIRPITDCMKWEIDRRRTILNVRVGIPCRSGTFILSIIPDSF